MTATPDRLFEDPKTKQLVAITYAGMCREYPSPKAQFSNGTLYFPSQKEAEAFYIGKGWREISHRREPK